MTDPATRRNEDRLELRNQAMRIDFDARTSDTMYNYIHLLRPDTGQWERVHNFGVDVGAYKTGTGELTNTIGMNLGLDRLDGGLRVTYPDPLIEYRHFDDKIGPPELVARYPDIPPAEAASLPRAEGSLEFAYRIDPERPSFVVSGRVLRGRIHSVVYILSALWTDNHALPTHEYIEGFGEFDTRSPEAVHCRRVEVENVAFAIFYRHDGNGVPMALLPQQPLRAGVCNYYDNWKCLADFRTASLNQQFVPRDPAVAGCNDTGYIVSPGPDGALPGVRVAFFPELGWLAGGLGHRLRDRIVESIATNYRDAVDSWDRRGRDLPPRLTLTAPPVV